MASIQQIVRVFSVFSHCKNAEETQDGRRIHREFDHLSMVVKPGDAEQLPGRIQAAIDDHAMKEACLLSYDAPVARTVLGGRK